MHIEVISYNTVKAVLTKDDLKEFELSYKLLDQDSLDTQMLLLYIIDEVKTQKDIDLSEQKIYIEIFPIKDSGCLFYFSVIDENEIKAPDTEMCEQICAMTDDINKILEMSLQLYKSSLNNILNSEIYYSDRYFYIIISTVREYTFSLKNIISEYCDIVGIGEVYSAMIREHYEYISDKDALKALAEL